jgi:hypothetical protein
MFPNEDWWYEGERIVIGEGRIEIRCPGKFKKLFLVLRQEHMPQEDMLMEIACADCAREAKAAGFIKVVRVLHYYDTSGSCVTTKPVLADQKISR